MYTSLKCLYDCWLWGFELLLLFSRNRSNVWFNLDECVFVIGDQFGVKTWNSVLSSRNLTLIKMVKHNRIYHRCNLRWNYINLARFGSAVLYFPNVWYGLLIWNQKSLEHLIPLLIYVSLTWDKNGFDHGWIVLSLFKELLFCYSKNLNSRFWKERSFILKL